MDSDRLKGTAQELSGKVQSGFGKTMGDESTRAEGMAREAGGRAQDVYGQAKDQMRDVAGDAAGAVRDAYDNSDAYARSGIDSLEKAVGKHPLTYVLVAAAIGYLLSLIFHGGRR